MVAKIATACPDARTAEKPPDRVGVLSSVVPPLLTAPVLAPSLSVAAVTEAVAVGACVIV